MKTSNTKIISEIVEKSQLDHFDLDTIQNRKLLNRQLYDRLNSLEPHREKRNKTVKSCYQFFARDVYKHIETNKLKSDIKTAISCKHRFCAQCQYIKSRKLFHEVYQSLSYISTLHKGSTYYLLTLTYPNPKLQDLRSTIALMKKAWKLMSNPTTTTKKYASIKKNLRGYFSTLEFITDKTPKGEAHPHFHIVLVFNKTYSNSKDYITRKEWLSMWQYATKNSNITQVDIKKIKPIITPKLGKLKSDLVGAVSEVVKYSAKPTTILNLDDQDLKLLLEQTERVHTFTRTKYFTDLLKILKTDPEIQRLKEEEDLLWQFLYSETYAYNSKGYKLMSSSKPKPIQPEEAETLNVIIDDKYLM